MAAHNECRLCGADAAFSCDDARPRSEKHLRFYFAMIRVLFDNWPEAHLETGELLTFRPSSPVELRKHLQILADYDEKTRIIVKERAAVFAAEATVMATLRAQGDYAVVEVHGQVILVRHSKSIRYGQLGEKKFSDLHQAVSEVAYAETGLDPVALMQGFEGGQREAHYRHATRD